MSEFRTEIVSPGRAASRIHGWIGIAGWRGLEAIYLPGWREQRPTPPIGDGQIGLHSPGILGIKLIPIQTVFATNRNSQLSSAGVKHVAVLVVVVIGNH